MLDANDPRLTAYLLGELDPDQRRALEAELQASPEMQESLEQLRRTSQTLEAALGSEPVPSLHPEQHAEIRQAAEAKSAQAEPAQPPITASGSSRTSLALVAVFATAALLLVAALGAAGWWQASGRPTAVLPSPQEPSATRNYDDELDPGLMDRGYMDYSNEAPTDTSTTAPGSQNPSLTMGLDASGNPTADLDGGFSRPEATDLTSELSNPSRTASPAGSGMPPGIGGALPGEGQPGGFGGSPGGGGPGFGVGGGGIGGSGPGVPRGEELGDAGDGRPDDDPFGAESSSRPGFGKQTEAPRTQPNRVPALAPAAADPQPASGGDGAQPFGPSGVGGKDMRANDAVIAGGGQPRPAIVSGPVAAPEGTDGDAAAEGEEEDSKSPKKSSEPGTQESTTWQRSQVVPNASRLRVGDRDDLPLQGMQVNVVVDGFRARVLLDCYYYNNQPRQLEGAFKLRLPNEASLYYFAFGEAAFEYRPMVDQLASRGFLPADVVRSSGTGLDGIRKARSETWTKVKEARLVPREKAAHAYSEVVRRRVDPALVEWSGAGVFQAKVFPLMPNKLHRIVIGYDVNLQQVGDDLVYRLDLPEDVAERSVDLDVSAFPGTEVDVTGDARPFVSGGRAYYHFPEPPQEIKVRVKAPGTLLLKGQDAAGSKFFASRFTPELPQDADQQGASQAIFLVDTSLSSNPDKFNIWLRMLESALNENRGSLDQFAVLFFNVESHWWKEGLQKNTPDNVKALMRHCQTLALEGATDLEQAVQEAVHPSWAKKQARAKSPDLFLLSDGAITWGGRNQHQLAAALQSAGATLFAYNTGMNGTDNEMLEHLARESGGAVFRVTAEADVETAAKAHRQRPWQLVTATVPGSNDILIAGRPRSIYPGQSLLLVGRGEVDAEASLQLRRGDQTHDVSVPFHRAVDSELAARLYGQVSVGQLENLGENTYQMSVAYARHFRVTGNTCSLLMLESEADYQRFNIRDEDDAFVVKSSPVDPLITRKLDELAGQLDDPKQATLQWLKKLEATPGMEFKIPVALQLSLEQMPRKAFELKLSPLECKQRSREDLPKDYFQHLDSTELDYEVIVKEADRRQKSLGNADALKALSSLIERNPGDPVLTQDVAFTAIQWGFGGQAYPLLRRVAESRPYLPHIYPALAQCVADLGNADLAMVYYEIALNGKWHQRYRDVREIATVQYAQLLRRIVSGELDATAKDFAQARLDNLNRQGAGSADLVVVMMWNTDRTDVDLHVVEPNGDECYYKNRNTRAGGKITHDVTEGFGPEMYRINKAAGGRYQILANYYGSDANRTQLRTKVFVTVYENFGREDEEIHRHTVLLSVGKEKRELAEVNLSK